MITIKINDKHPSEEEIFLLKKSISNLVEEQLFTIGIDNDTTNTINKNTIHEIEYGIRFVMDNIHHVSLIYSKYFNKYEINIIHIHENNIIQFCVTLITFDGKDFPLGWLVSINGD